ncbi:glycosyltransferase family 4 protein [Idiomarina baltica]|uniref:Glycosyltransferase protein n=1 Tax=Idiomarina baltica OS145 TaxID=314276 RepID=A0ABM9WLU8_9GAMM|nr:glycosyltransferase family 4 protein [Idiomarina baltica]EAQ31904.1 putative glycosyltransferase protein [Idiomarina baltica OS145]
MKDLNNKSKKKVTLIIPTLLAGGAERVISEIANELAKNYQVSVELVVLVNEPNFYDINEKVVVRQLDFKTNKRGFSKFKEIFKVLFRLRSVLRNNNTDSIVSFMDKTNLIVLISTLGLKSNVFISDRSNPFRPRPLVVRFLKKAIYPSAKGIIAQTKRSALAIQNETGHGNVSIIPNPVRKFESKENLTKSKVIISIGRLVPEKGHKYLLRAFSKLSATGWKLIILGDGPLKESLFKEARDLGLDPSSIFLGVHKDVDNWVRSSSIFVLPSISEGFPNALLEAMVLGTACISFNCDVGPSDIIKHRQNGLLVDTGDVEELSKSMQLLIKDEEYRSFLAENALQSVSRFNINKIVEEYRKFILD